MNILVLVLLIMLLGLGVIVYFLHLKLENLILRISNILRNIDALYVNQQTFDADMKKLFNELQNVKKEINRGGK